MIKFIKKVYTTLSCSINWMNRTKNIVLNAILTTSNKQINRMLKPCYTADKCNITYFGLQYKLC